MNMRPPINFLHIFASRLRNNTLGSASACLATGWAVEWTPELANRYRFFDTVASLMDHLAAERHDAEATASAKRASGKDVPFRTQIILEFLDGIEGQISAVKALPLPKLGGTFNDADAA